MSPKRIAQWTSVLSLFSSICLASDFIIDKDHTTVGFKVKHLMFSNVTGKFKDFSGAFKYDNKTGKLEDLKVSIQIASVDTGNEKRDTHLKSADFFNVDSKEEKFQTIEFVADKVDYKNKKPNEISGKITMHGKTQPIKLTVKENGMAKDPWGNQRLAFEAHGELKRKEFDINFDKTFDDKKNFVVSNEIKIEIEGEAIMKAEEKK